MGVLSDMKSDLEASAAELLDEYKDRLMAEALRICADEASAEDLVMRTFEVYLFKREKYDPQRGSLLAWLRAVMRNLQTDSLRRRKVDEVVMSPDEIERLIDAQLPADLHDDAERAAIEERVLSEAVNALSPKIREAVVLHYFESLPVAEVARQLRVSENSIKNRLFYARKVLTKRLKGKLGKKPLAVLAVLLFGITALFGAYQLGKVEKVEEVEEEWRSGILSASGQEGEPSVSATPVAGADVPGGPEAETNDVPAVESISANEQEGTNEMKEVQVVKALAGAASAVTIAAAPLLAAAEEDPKPYDAIVDYVQSTGTQCVDTGVKLGPTHTVVLKFARVDGSAIGQNVFGYSPAISGSDIKAFIIELAGFGEGEQGLKILRNDVAAERLRLNFGKPTTVDHELRVGPDGYYLDGISMPPCVGAMLSGACAGNAHIFGVGWGWQPGYACGVVRVKACQIYDGANLVRDFRPVRKDGAGRLYDCVSKTLYATKGTGALAKGPDSAEQEFGELKFTKNVTVMNRRLKYIESTGVQAVTVDAKEGATTETTIRFSCSTPLTTTGLKNFYGYSASGSGTDDRGFAIARELVDGQERFYLYRRETSTDRKEIRTPLTAFDSKDHVLVLSNGVYKLDGVAYGPMPNFTRDCSYSGCLFATYANFRVRVKINDGTSLWIDQGLYRDDTRDISGCPARLYSFVMKRDGKKVRHLVPMQTAIGVGLWDTVANRFHPCISYSGDFIAGPPAPGLVLMVY